MSNKKYRENWSDFDREDLKIHFDMECLSWKPQYSWHDEKIGRTTITNPPHFPINYARGDERLWLCKQGWRLAKFDGRKYYDHKWVNINNILAEDY